MKTSKMDEQTLEKCDKNCGVQKINETKKKKSNRRIFITAISTGLVMLILLYSYVSSFITHIIDVNAKIDKIIQTTVLTEENMPATWLEKYQLYKEFNNLEQWDYEKYNDPIWQKVKDNVSEGCDSYHVTVSGIFHTNNLSLRCPSEIYVDGNVAHGTINVNLRYDDETKNENVELYCKDIEFYRVLENDKITTYMSVDGENWLKKNGFFFNNDNVLFDLKKLIDNIDMKNASYFPNYYNNNDDKLIAISVNTNEPYNKIFADEGFLYYECDDFNEIYMTLYEDSYLPEMISLSSAQIDEEKLYNMLSSTNDPILKKLCDSEMKCWPIYKFEQYGEIEIELPSELSDAELVDGFSELFIDLYDAIDTYASPSEWR